MCARLLCYPCTDSLPDVKAMFAQLVENLFLAGHILPFSESARLLQSDDTEAARSVEGQEGRTVVSCVEPCANQTGLVCLRNLVFTSCFCLFLASPQHCSKMSLSSLCEWEACVRGASSLFPWSFDGRSFWTWLSSACGHLLFPPWSRLHVGLVQSGGLLLLCRRWWLSLALLRSKTSQHLPKFGLNCSTRRLKKKKSTWFFSEVILAILET